MDIYKDITLILVTYRSERLILKNLEVLKQFPVNPTSTLHIQLLASAFDSPMSREDSANAK